LKSPDLIEKLVVKLVVKLGKVIEKEHFEFLFGVSASKHALHVTVGSTKPMDEIRDDLSL
jgi:hypothetical protein